MKRYLDPKADITFVKTFVENNDLLISLINSLLPLKEDELAKEAEFLFPESVHGIYLGRNKSIDVRCKDVKGKVFFVKIQTLWSLVFQYCVLFNASKAFVRQLDTRRKFETLQPVYSLNLVNEVFMKDYPDEFIHNYKIVHDLHNDKVIEGLHFTFIELPKFQPHSIKEKKMAVLWLKFLTEIDENTTTVPQELLDNPETNKALTNVEESAMSKSEMLAYDDFWDKMGAERLLFVDSNRISREEGRKEGRKEGRAEGAEMEKIASAKRLLAMGLTSEQVALGVDMSIEEVKKLVE